MSPWKRCHPTTAITIVLILLPVAVLATPVPSAAQAAGKIAADAEGLEWLTGPVVLLLTPDELDVARRIDAGQRPTFLDWVWARRDPRPETRRNEFREQFNERVDYVDRIYREPLTGRPGWQTPRGLCYLILGRPDVMSEGTVILPQLGGRHAAEMWRYVGHADRIGTHDLQIVFAAVEQRSVIVMGRTQREALLLQQALVAATRRTVHDPDWTFGAPASGDRLEAALPVQAAVVGDGDGHDVALSIAVNALYGTTIDGALRVAFDFFIIDGAGERNRFRHLNPADAIALELTIAPTQVGADPGRPVHMLLRLPRSAVAAHADPTLLIVERATGRSTSIALAEDAVAPSDPMPARFPIDHLLAVATSRGGGPLAVAFLAAANADAVNGDVLWLSRGAPAVDGEELMFAGEEIRLGRGGVPVLHGRR